MAATTLSLDAMGGDKGPGMTIAGAAISAMRHPACRFLLYGDEALIKPELERHPHLADRAEIRHTDVAVAMDAKPSQALRQGRRTSSMWLAIEAVKKGEAGAVISAGNTGALMAMSKFCLKTMPGIERPAIAAIWPTVHAECLVLDVGANVGATARQLCDFAILGAAMSRSLFDHAAPDVALLNIGEEEVKGLDQVKAAGAWLRENGRDMTYRGFVEGNQIGQGAADVVVTEGFSGNIALKTAEGTATQIGAYIRASLTSSLPSRLGALFARGGLRFLKEKMDPGRRNGGVFLGLNGIAIKSHGGADPEGFASAIDLGYDMARTGLIDRIAEDISRVADIEQADVSQLQKPAMPVTEGIAH